MRFVLCPCLLDFYPDGQGWTSVMDKNMVATEEM